jgi:hypothetical protein
LIVLISARHLLIKLRQPRSRADQLVELHRRLDAELGGSAGDDERALAAEVHTRKLEVAAILEGTTSCSTCGRGFPPPMGAHDGGACCSGVTAHLFDDAELAMLVYAGTRARHLVPPPRDDVHAGCAFRGKTGCTLDVAHRPARCVHYACDSLKRELHARGRLDAIEPMLDALAAARARFAAAHKARTDRDVLAPLFS